MKKVVFIGNRLNVIERLKNLADVELVRAYVLEGSLLDRNLSGLGLNEALVETFTMQEKQRLFDELSNLDFDILISNGCPFILPVTSMKKEHQLFINIHPTLLPDLKGKTPLSGVFLTHRQFIGATMHYIDDGIDTGKIIFQEKIELTDDIDQGLVYKLSFDLEGVAFQKGFQLLQENQFQFDGTAQQGEGSYFNRTDDLQTIDVTSDTTDLIIDKIKSFNLRGQGTTFPAAENTYRVYFAEKIVNPYILDTYKEVATAAIAFTYDNKVVIKTVDGMVKLTDYERVV